ncbi:MAG: PhoH family protein [Leptospiraceae bacterium]|nr:PhoH family protein [Leptospiraceae bacterium]MDW7975793.1 PhoH family protein [Leptospiraceae bacterium]
MSIIKKRKHYTFENTKLYRLLCGVADQNLLELEKLLDVELIPRGDSFIIQSTDETKIKKTIAFFGTLEAYLHNREIETFDAKYLFNLFQNNHFNNESNQDNFDDSSTKTFIEQEKFFITHRGKPIFAKTINQQEYIKSLLQNPITIAIGPAGTGKTFLGVVVASKLLLKGDIERIIITRPAVEAGESLGYLPGDIIQKVDPYLRPIYDSLYESLGTEKTTQFIQSNRIEVAPLAYMRGRTLNDSMIILDEAQNCTLSQLKMFLTRIGKNSKMCISGDITQSDLKPGQSGLAKLLEILKPIPEVKVIEFNKNDIVRNPIVEKIIHAFETYEKKEKNKNPT